MVNEGGAHTAILRPPDGPRSRRPRYTNALLDSLQPGDAVVLADLDHFKAVSDTFGHEGANASGVCRYEVGRLPVG